ncbi:2-hydroxychromene-2-carboxylate isomerase [Bosea caraganae]|uniref:2-hydroxychromene-2-carboxylate isomerase n=2 Tax=Bosea caraganae TaxID=2763117 RepID=A0A370L8S4_9HYPH|nr:2-hydroxychromene-2-carboxylate isomerase [Bosea caraganae]RDJ26798.1 2-hydroxychromene-2-carboxylate isomerase [Bosea caraganae]
MSRQIDYFFTLSSPWAYLGHAAFVETATRHGVEVSYRPMPVRAVFDETGGLPLPKRHPARQRYRLVELQRWRQRRGLPLSLQARSGSFDPSLADRLVIAIIASGSDPDAFLRRAFHALWADALDLADEAVLARLVASVGLDAEPLLEAAAAPASHERYEQNRIEAIAAGVFGAPSYILDGELFWGQDRVELLDEALSEGRAAYLP